MATRYVSTAGTDSGDGLTLATAWLTLQYANDNADASDTIIVAAGAYNEDDATFHAFNPDKAMTWIANGVVTVTSTSTSYVIVPQGSAAAISFDEFIFDGEGTTAHVNFFSSGQDNKTFTYCKFTGGSTTLISGTGSSDTIIFISCDYEADCSGVAINAGAATNFSVTGGSISGTAKSLLNTTASSGEVIVSGLSGSLAPSAADRFIHYRGDTDLSVLNNSLTLTGTWQGIVNTDTGANSGALNVESNTLLVTGNIGASVVSVTAGTDHKVRVSGNTITMTDPSNATSVISISNNENALVENNDIDVRLATAISSVIVINSTGSAAHHGKVRGNTIRSKRTGAGNLILIGADSAGAGDELCNDGEISRNTLYCAGYYGLTPNGIHGLESGYALRTKIYGNPVYGASFGIVIKGGDGVDTGSDFGGKGGACGNLLVDCTQSSSIRLKGAINVPVCNNTLIASTASVANGLIHITINDDTAANEVSTGTILKNNVAYTTTNKMLVKMDAACLTSDYDAANNIYYNSAADGFSMSFDGGSTTLTSLAAAQAALATASAAGQEANTATTDPLFTDYQDAGAGDYSISSTSSPAYSVGVKYWTGGNPTGFDGEPIADFGTDIGGSQSTLNPFHPVNL